MPEETAPKGQLNRGLGRLNNVLADDYDQRLAHAILGTADAREIWTALSMFCRGQLGCGIADVISCAFSVGATFGLLLDDGRRVFLKAWSPSTPADGLNAVHAVQAGLADEGFPAPGVLVVPTPFMAGRAAAMQWLDRGAEADAHAPSVRRAMAANLAQLITLAEPFVALPGLPHHAYPQNAVWGATHNILFDFGATASGAEWIDEVAAVSVRAARQGEGRTVVGHIDWSVKNLRFDSTANGTPYVSAVYDWDSLAVAREPVVIGMAAASFTTTWSLPLTHVLPTREEMLAFVVDYEAAIGRGFTAAERRTAGAAAIYLLAYTARCEHCSSDSKESDGAQGTLRECMSAGPDRLF